MGSKLRPVASSQEKSSEKIHNFFGFGFLRETTTLLSGTNGVSTAPTTIVNKNL